MTSERRPKINVKANCTCGACSVAIDGEVLSMMLCTCTQCQKLTGAGHTALALFRQADVTVDGDATQFTRPADSGATLTRSFCTVCGAMLTAASSRGNSLTIVSPGLFEDQSWFTPGQILFGKSRTHWDVLPDIPVHDTYPEKRT